MTLLDERKPVDGPKPVFEGTKRRGEQLMLYTFVILPFLAFLAVVPVAWGWGLGWTDVILFVVFYYLSGLGVTVGYHRLFTHGSFKANRPLRVALAVAGSMAIEGLIRWVADHRRHHQPTVIGTATRIRRGGTATSAAALFKGLCWAHLGWMFDENHTNRGEVRAGPDERTRTSGSSESCSRSSLLASLFLPPAIAGLIHMSWGAALSAFFWASLVRVFLLHHVTWSINSICHTIGDRPFQARDKSTNFWPLAILSFEGEHGTTCITPTPPLPGTECCPGSWTPPHGSSGSSRSSVGPPTCDGRRPNGSRSCAARPDAPRLAG